MRLITPKRLKENEDAMWQLADGVLVLVGGTLLLTPGFVTDAVGFTSYASYTVAAAASAGPMGLSML